MAIELMMRPKDVPLSWDEFDAQKPAFSVAIDGYVKEGPRFNRVAPRANFNHHGGVATLETRATCAQALMEIRGGIFRRFQIDGQPQMLIWANDCDEDVCSTVAAFRNHELVINTTNPLWNRLIGMEDLLDTTGGAYAFSPTRESMQELAWVFEPYRLARGAGIIDTKNAAIFTSIVADVELRILQYVSGKSRKIQLDTRYKFLGRGQTFWMIQEVGSYGKFGAIVDGAEALVIVRQRPDGRYTYSLWCKSQWMPFRQSELYVPLNELEGDVAKTDPWGGGDLNGGSCRVNGSGIHPDTLFNFLTELEKIWLSQ